MKERFRVTMERRGAPTLEVYTEAASKDQAKRFAHKRKPGYTAVKVVKDPRKPNPPTGTLISENVQLVAYRHVEDGRDYLHEFENDGIKLEALPDGSLRVYHPEFRLWGDF